MFHLMKGKTTMIYFNYTNVLNRNLKSQFGIDMTDSDYSVRIDVYYVDQDDVTGNIAMVTSGTISISPFDKTNSAMCKKVDSLSCSTFRYYIFDSECGDDNSKTALCIILDIDRNEEIDDWKELIDPDLDYWHGWRSDMCNASRYTIDENGTTRIKSKSEMRLSQLESLYLQKREISTCKEKDEQETNEE